jgi:hypothetical protein
MHSTLVSAVFIATVMSVGHVHACGQCAPAIWSQYRAAYAKGDFNLATQLRTAVGQPFNNNLVESAVWNALK